METWISDIESMFQEGLTDVHIPANRWAALSSKNTLKTDLMQYTTTMAGLPVMIGLNGQPTTMLGALLAGENPFKCSYGFVDSPNLLYESSILTLPGMATYARQMDWSSDLTTGSNVIYSENVCTDFNPPPTSNPFKKSWNSFKEIGTDYWTGLQTRADKALDSPYDFVNYMTIGASEALISGAKTRADKLADSPEDFVNYATIGVSGMVKEAIMPENPFSKEHWANSFGVASLAVGGVKVVGSKGSVGTVGGKESVRSQESIKSLGVDAGEGASKFSNSSESLSRIEYLHSKYGKFTPQELNHRINLRGAVEIEVERLNTLGLTKNEMGPAVAGTFDKTTGKY